MSYIQIGELYFVKELFWFLYPTKEMTATSHAWATKAYQDAKWWSERYKCNVPVAEENTYVVLLEADEDYCKLLDCNGNIGWISCSDFSRYFERVKANQ